jgi:hypothetical protein
MTPNPSASIPIVEVSGNMTQTFRTWTSAVTKGLIIIGIGSPEGVLIGDQGQEYMDETGALGSIKYIKQLREIGGDSSLGWVAIG